MPLDLRNSFPSDFLPKNRAFLFVACVNLVRVFRIIFYRRDVTVEPEFRFVFTGADSGGDEYLVSPNDWTRVGQTCDRGLLTHVGLCRRVPLDGLRRTF